MEYALFLLLDILVLFLFAKVFVCPNGDCRKVLNRSATASHTKKSVINSESKNEEKRPALLAATLSENLDVMADQLMATITPESMRFTA